MLLIIDMKMYNSVTSFDAKLNFVIDKYLLIKCNIATKVILLNSKHNLHMTNSP